MTGIHIHSRLVYSQNKLIMNRIPYFILLSAYSTCRTPKLIAHRAISSQSGSQRSRIAPRPNPLLTHINLGLGLHKRFVCLFWSCVLINFIISPTRFLYVAPLYFFTKNIAECVTDSDRRTRRRRTLAQGSQTVTDGVRATLEQGDTRHSYTN